MPPSLLSSRTPNFTLSHAPELCRSSFFSFLWFSFHLRSLLTTQHGYSLIQNSDCPPHWTGAACDWPICVHGRANPATKLCNCYNYYSPPFCISCLPGYWGESCDRQPLKGVTSASDFPIRVPPFLVKPILFAIAILIVLLILFVIYRIRIYIRSRKPPRYDDIAKDLPPPYSS
ncbi:Protein CBG02928 [Caenorhabditis briggsae]|uniref:Protein CBG02928 n=1 Tax=Caenorhabditis briggsae TaxID=6238 RepID=A8WT71_CAEBR|nr:Protein CBG02928 [Caenorhabditis briggsae]CAP23682.1 Protein CBG02928 [Caenorhabditis briggsae]